MTTIQTQAEANAFWADKDHKKFVVEFKAGTLRKPKRWQVNVGAANTNGARRAGLAAADLMGHTWCRSAMSTVRLATAQDLGCVATGEKGGVA